jgi:hypothetical protein
MGDGNEEDEEDKKDKKDEEDKSNLSNSQRFDSRSILKQPIKMD